MMLTQRRSSTLTSSSRLTKRSSSPRVQRARLALLCGATMLASSCGGSGGDHAPTQPVPQPPEQPTQPSAPAAVPGTLTARLVTPNTDDGAILVEIAGPTPVADVATPVPGAVVHSRGSGNTARVAVFGSLAAGALVRFSVPDVNAASQYTATVTEASDRANALRASVTGYQITIAP
jgi:hypothetical protein